MSNRKKRQIVFVATAAKETGAWRIVTEFARLAESDTSTNYTFITLAPLNNPGVRNILVNIDGIADRVIFEIFRFRSFLRSNAITPDVVISLGGLAVLGAIGTPQYIYIHNSIPFYPEFKWSLRRRERTLFFYQNVYGVLMWLSVKLTSSKVIVQTQTMAERVQSQWRMQSLCWFPNYRLSKRDGIVNKTSEIVHFFYPATLFPYKNHIVLAQALMIIKNTRQDIYRTIEIRFTLAETERTEDFSDPRILFSGTCSYEAMLEHYQMAACVLFPSVLETVGLPLVEASGLGIPIICSDFGYTREILANYTGACFVPATDALDWANAIIVATESAIKNGAPVRFNSYVIDIPETKLSDIHF